MVVGLGALGLLRQRTSNTITVLAFDVNYSDTEINDDVTVYDKHLEQAKSVFRWVADSPDSYVSNKQVLRRAIPGDINSPLGVYATDRIEPNEVITIVPWEYIIAPKTSEEEDDEYDDEEELGDQLSCGLVESLSWELRQGNESRYAPYIEYLNSEPDGQIPTSWGEEANELYYKVLDGQSIPPYYTTNWLDHAKEECEVDPDDMYIRKAVLLIIQRADDHIMIPAYDAYNHRNGKWKNTRTKIVDGEYHETVASKTIEPGEQILLSYNFCDQCAGRTHQYGTAGKLKRGRDNAWSAPSSSDFFFLWNFFY
jgi:hypothetical protein